MKKGIYLLVFALAVAALVSCGHGEGNNALREMEKIVEMAEKDKDKLSKEEWKELAARFEENEKIANEAADNNRLGVAGKMKCLTLTIRWATVYGQTMMREITPKVNDVLQTLGSELEKMADSLGEDSISLSALPYR